MKTTTIFRAATVQRAPFFGIFTGRVLDTRFCAYPEPTTFLRVGNEATTMVLIVPQRVEVTAGEEVCARFFLDRQGDCARTYEVERVERPPADAPAARVELDLLARELLTTSRTSTDTEPAALTAALLRLGARAIALAHRFRVFGAH